MSPDVALIFCSLTLFLVKHYICDYVLQTKYQWQHKGIYGHPGGFVHAGVHMIGSLPAILVLSQVPALIAAIMAGEFVIHYHLDWLKEQVNKRRALLPDQSLFWMVFGADQLLHQMTYVLILVILVRGVTL